MIVGALVWDQIARARLGDALRKEGSVQFCDRLSDVLALVESGMAKVVVVDRHDRFGVSTLSGVGRIRTDFPSVPVILYCRLTNDATREVLQFARAGVNQLVFQGVDDEYAPLRTAVGAALDHAAASQWTHELEPLVPPPVVPFLRYCLEHGRRDFSVEEAATALAVHRKTLVDRLNAAGLPSPSAIASWCRLLSAAQQLEDPGRTVEDVAMQLDFPSGTSLRNMMKRYMGLRSAEVRENGGVRCVLHAFKRELLRSGDGQRPQWRAVNG